MPRYIDIDKLRNMICAKAETVLNCKEVFYYIAKWIEFLPHADVVEVVRCSDCVYRTGYINKNGFEVCPVSGMDITDDDFCSLGERKEQQ